MSNPNLHVVETNWEELKQKIRQHRIRRLRRILIVVAVCIAAAIAFYAFMEYKTYDDYTITEEISRSDTAATHYLAFANGYLKYSNDGISYVTIDSQIIWNQGYGMENPMVSVCDSFVAVADREGETVYVLNTDGLLSEISVTMPVLRVEVASLGTVAVLMEEDSTGYLSLFDKSGNLLAEGALYMENSGTPMDIALSTDGTNLSVAIVDISSGTASTTIQCYNFGSSGQNQIDNLMGTIVYADTVIPKLAYVSDSRLLAFGADGVYVISTSGTPVEEVYVEATDEIQSVFYDESYIGLVFADVTKDAGRIISVYDMSGRERVVIETEFSYDTIGFLDNHEICMYNTTSCSIFSLRGREKFSYTFTQQIYGIFHENGWRNYVVLKEGVTERIRLKLIDDLSVLWPMAGEDE